MTVMTATTTDIQFGGDASGELSASFKDELVRPGDPAYAHRTDERVEIAALERCWDLLRSFLCCA